MMTTTNPGYALTFSFPQGYYVETEYRLTPLWSGNTPTSGPNGLWFWQKPPSEPHCTVDMEFAELYGHKNGFGAGYAITWCPWNSSSSIWISYAAHTLPAGWAPNNYHKYTGMRTHNNTNSLFSCQWVDDIFQVGAANGCRQGFQNYLSTFGNRSWLIAWTGTYDETATAIPDTTTFFKYIRVWSCANWATGNCGGSVLFDNGAGLKYWH